MFEWYDLNSRHEAVALWIGAFLLYAVVTSSAVRESSFGLVKILLQKTILLSFVGFFAGVGHLNYTCSKRGKVCRPLGNYSSSYRASVVFRFRGGSAHELQQLP